MCHFEKDSLKGYGGQKIEMNGEDILDLFHHIYSKEYGNKKMNLRDEVQEYPNKPLEDALMDKLKYENKEPTEII
jgi:hypothetical protein